jgi:hypothetical protein
MHVQICECRANETRLLYVTDDDSYLLIKGGGKLRPQWLAGKRACDLYELCEIIMTEGMVSVIEWENGLLHWFKHGRHWRKDGMLCCEIVPPATKQAWTTPVDKVLRAGGLNDWILN